MSEPGEANAAATSAPVIAIDGPAGAGKSTAAQRLARRLGFFLLDTGAIYRALALVARREGIAWDDGPRLGERAAGLALSFHDHPDGQRVEVDGEDLSEAIRRPEISDGASRVSAHPEVRAALLSLQRRIALRGGCVAEGRDIGTVVLPWAPLKFFVTASIEERARRRRAELAGRGHGEVPLEQVVAELRERDHRDESRAVAPLRPAEDAIRLDTSPLSLDEVVALMEAEARRRFGALLG